MKLLKSIGIVVSSLLLLSTSLFAGITAEAKKPFVDYIKQFPWIGLVASEINYGPIQIHDVKIHDGDKIAIVAPGEALSGSLKYKIKSKDLDSLHLYHLVIGIKGEGAQDCVTHSLGFWNSKGKGKFTLKAPTKPGVYEVRFLFIEGSTCESARNAWDHGDQEPSSSATIGVIVVE